MLLQYPYTFVTLYPNDNAIPRVYTGLRLGFITRDSKDGLTRLLLNDQHGQWGFSTHPDDAVYVTFEKDVRCIITGKTPSDNRFTWVLQLETGWPVY
jgi:hypothetical protein